MGIISLASGNSCWRGLDYYKNKKINRIIVKDLSRFARNHIEADMYFENIFPALNIRFISLNKPIISKENFNKVQEIIKSNKCARSNKEKDIFYSFLKCSDCGSSFILRKVKKYEYYHCKSYVRNGSCTSHSIRKDKLIELVIEELNKKCKRNKINTLTRNILLKDIDDIIISQDGEVTIKFK